jgi:dihydropteroate synthase
VSAVRDDRFLIFGILNITPDSFSDGGRYSDPQSSLERARELLASGANYVDVGAESTRPGAKPISAEDEWDRLEPFLKRAQAEQVIPHLSIDTRHVITMERVVDMGVSYINCVGPIPPETALKRFTRVSPNLGFIATHIQGTPEDMQLSPLAPKAAKRRVFSFFDNSHDELSLSGFAEANILLDPGIGFGKSDSANLALLSMVAEWSKRFQIAIGVSRKGFIGRLFGGSSPQERDPFSKVLETSAILSGAKMIRTHDVAALKRIGQYLEEAKG